MRFYSLVAAAALLSASLASHAAPITYNLNLTVGSDTAIGTITTDGKFGVLNTADILGYSVALSNGSTSVLSGIGSSDFIDGSDTTATAQGLFFNYSGTDTGAFSLNPSAGSYLCIIDAEVTCSGHGDGVSEIAINEVVSDNAAPLVGVQEFATATSVTPEPSSLALLGTGILGVAGVIRKRLA